MLFSTAMEAHHLHIVCLLSPNFNPRSLCDWGYFFERGVAATYSY